MSNVPEEENVQTYHEVVAADTIVELNPSRTNALPNVTGETRPQNAAGEAGEPDMSEILARNPRVEKVLVFEDEIRRQREQENIRNERIRQEQEYINKMMNLSVKEALHDTKEERKYNEAFEEQIRTQVYHMYGLSDDKIQGMYEYRNAWYQGTSFTLFLLSTILFIICALLHGFHTEITLFMIFYTAIQGSLLTNDKHLTRFAGILLKTLYLLLFPVMLIVFVCYELNLFKFEAWLPALTIAGAVILFFGVASYFFYDPYRTDRKIHKKAERYLRDIEKKALKEVRRKQKAYEKEERKRKKKEKKETSR